MVKSGSNGGKAQKREDIFRMSNIRKYVEGDAL